MLCYDRKIWKEYTRLRDQKQPSSCLIQKANLEEALLEERWMERLPGLMWYGSMVHHVLCISYSRETDELPDVCLLTESVKFREPLFSFLFQGMHRFLGRRRSPDVMPPANFRNPSTGVCTCLWVECDRDNETVWGDTVAYVTWIPIWGAGMYLACRSVFFLRNSDGTTLGRTPLGCNKM